MALPAWMLILGSVFPVKWMAQGFRSVLLPPEMAAFEPAGSWEHWLTFLMLDGVERRRIDRLPHRFSLVGHQVASSHMLPYSR